jgi:ketosteroid isomerase-like protein
MENAAPDHGRHARPYAGFHFDAALMERAALVAKVNRGLPSIPRRHDPAAPVARAIVRMAFEAIGRGDVDELLDLYDRDFAEVAEVWDEMRPYANEVTTTGNRVVVSGGCAVRGKASAVACDSPMAWVITIRNRKITSLRGYRTHADALAAAGPRG